MESKAGFFSWHDSQTHRNASQTRNGVRRGLGGKSANFQHNNDHGFFLHVKEDVLCIELINATKITGGALFHRKSSR